MVQRSRITDKATVGRVYEVYRAWCSDNNHGFAKTAREFRDTIAAHLNTTPASMTIRTKHGIAYSGYTLSNDAKQQYVRIYGYDATEF